MTRILERVADHFAILAGVVLFIIVVVTATNTAAFVLHRIAQLSGGSVGGLPGYEDFVQLAISGAALMFFPYCQAHRGHVAVELFMDRFPQVVQRAADCVWLLLTVAIALFLAYWMVLGMVEARDDGAVTSVLGWQIWPFYIPGIASMILWALVAASQLFGGARHA